ncbi:MAG: SpoIVB peptidase [Clostridia bacterium]|nr:SpoIVB peptidase [Clostridia bacterium]MDD4047840.1 SpoIVB peptidase [Clostridia bacterium]
MWRKKNLLLGVFITIAFLAAFMLPQVQSYYNLHDKQRVSVGEPLELFLRLPPSILKAIDVYVNDSEKILTMEGEELTQGKYVLGVTSPIGVKPGNVSLELKLFGLIPLKIINIDVTPDITLTPGGHSIGVLLRTDGVLVVGFSPVLDKNNETHFPARDADIRVGDIITNINGINIINDDQVKNIISKSSQSNICLTIAVTRNGKKLRRVVQPQYCNDTKSYRIGLFVRDNAGGIGTLTFYDPISKKYGALGHMITDTETNQKLNIRQGKILYASIEDVKKGRTGEPGEKVGLFLENTEFGNIEKNDTCGIYGTSKKDIKNTFFEEPIPILYSNQIKCGKAQILTVLEGEEVKKYDISIEKVLSNRIDGKNMIVRITDKRLLEITGGIIQGMSGSPILQNGKLAGAVTHVFINDPSRGYGVFIENMLLEADVFTKNNKQALEYYSQGLFIYPHSWTSLALYRFN